MYMDDLGVRTDDFGRVDVDGFVKYRQIVEPKQPLVLVSANFQSLSESPRSRQVGRD